MGQETSVCVQKTAKAERTGEPWRRLSEAGPLRRFQEKTEGKRKWTLRCNTPCCKYFRREERDREGEERMAKGGELDGGMWEKIPSGRENSSRIPEKKTCVHFD